MTAHAQTRRAGFVVLWPALVFNRCLTQVAVELCFEELPNSEMLILPLVRQFVHQPRVVARFCGQCARKVRRIANGDRVFRWRQLPLASCSCRLTIGEIVRVPLPRCLSPIPCYNECYENIPINCNAILCRPDSCVLSLRERNIPKCLPVKPNSFCWPYLGKLLFRSVWICNVAYL